MTSRELCALNCFLAGLGSYMYEDSPLRVLLAVAATCFALMWAGLLVLQIRAQRRSGEGQL